MENSLKKFAMDLFKIDAIKFGQYKTKVGVMTPIYCDLRIIVSHPQLLNTLAELIISRLAEIGDIDIICGVPYTALPIATVVSVKEGIPMVMRRKEAKDYGTKKLIEGTFTPGSRCLIVEDVVTSGSSILETVKDLKEVGIHCSEAIVLLNREQGGAKLLKENGIKMHALLSLTQLVGYLKETGCIGEEWVDKVKDYLAATQVDSTVLEKRDRLSIPFSIRAASAKNPIAKQLFHLMETKKSNLCVAADLTTCADILNLAEEVGPHICLMKTHIDIVEDFNENFIEQLKKVALKHNFILFEDRKFADIGKTVELQYSKSMYAISSWASLVTAHSLTGRGVLDAIKQSDGMEKRGVFLLAETSAAGSLIDENYAKGSVKLAQEYPDLITGLVCQSPRFLEQLGFVQLTPGVQLGSTSDNLSQQYNSPEQVVLERGADVAVVGRGITKASNQGLQAEKYKGLLWEAYLKRISK